MRNRPAEFFIKYLTLDEICSQPTIRGCHSNKKKTNIDKNLCPENIDKQEAIEKQNKPYY